MLGVIIRIFERLVKELECNFNFNDLGGCGCFMCLDVYVELWVIGKFNLVILC